MKSLLVKIEKLIFGIFYKLSIKRYLNDNKDKTDYLKKVIKDNVRLNEALDYESAFKLGKILVQALKDTDLFTEMRCNILLTALHSKSVWEHQLAPSQLAGMVKAIICYDIETAEHGSIMKYGFPLTTGDLISYDIETSECSVAKYGETEDLVIGDPVIRAPYVIDNCGMGGDGIVTANVSTLSALIASCDGIPMLKHGSPSSTDSGRHGSSDFLSLLKIPTTMPPIEIRKSMKENNFAYIDASNKKYKRIHRSSSKGLSLPHMNGILGPMTVPVNPYQLQKKLMGTNSLIAPLVIAQTYQILNKETGGTNLKHGIFFRGVITIDNVKHYIDEISLEDNEVVELKDGKITEYRLSYKDFGLDKLYTDISPENCTKAEYSMDIIHGRHTGGGYHMVLCNTALLYYIHYGIPLIEGYQKAKHIVDSGTLINQIKKLSKS